MKIIHGYQQDGKFLIATVQDDWLSEDTNEIKEMIDATPGDGEGFVELSRQACQKISKHMQFGKKGEIRVTEGEKE